MGGDGRLQHCDYTTEFIAFLKGLEQEDPDTELLIVGDTFGFWELTLVHGTEKLEHIIKAHQGIFDQLRTTGACIKVTLMVGNHDYDLACDPAFADKLRSYNIHLDTSLALIRVAAARCSRESKRNALPRNGGRTRFDGLGRPDKVQITIGGETYTTTTEYDTASRIDKVFYPSGFAVAYSYNPTGYQFKLSNAVTSEVYWTAEARDAELHLTKQTSGNGVVTTQAFDPDTGQLTDITAGTGGAVHRQTYTYDLLGKLLTRSDANTSLSESFEYDTLNRLTKSTVSLSPTPWVQEVAYNAVGNITFKSDVGTYGYPAPDQPRPHGVTSITGGVINTTFTYDAKGNMISGNGLTVAYTSYNKTATITRGTTEIAFAHDTEHQRYSQLGPSGETLYLSGGGVFAERFAGLGGGGVQWTNYLIAGGRLVGVHIQKADETTATRYFHTDHLGSISVITKENGDVVERLSYDAWGKRRHPDGTPDPAGAITSEASRGFTGHEQLDSACPGEGRGPHDPHERAGRSPVRFLLPLLPTPWSLSTPSRQGRLHGGADALQGDGLGHHARQLRLQVLGAVQFVGEARDQDHAQLRLGGEALLGQRDAVHRGHLDIGDQQVEGAGRLQPLQRLGTILGRGHDMAVDGQRALDESAGGGVVVGQKDACHDAPSLAARASAMPHPPPHRNLAKASLPRIPAGAGTSSRRGRWARHRAKGTPKSGPISPPQS
jgi:hypothetical protein